MPQERQNLRTKSNLKIKGGNGLRLRRGQDNEETHSRTGPLTLTSNDPEEKRRGLFEGFGRNSDRPGAPYPLREQDGKIWLTWQGKIPAKYLRLQVFRAKESLVRTSNFTGLSKD